jgi:hypothetical protein
VPHPEGRVYGVLMTLMHSEIDRLYSEASVAAYRPEPVLAQLEDGTVEVALCFNLPTAPDGATTNPNTPPRCNPLHGRWGYRSTMRLDCRAEA